MSANSSLFLSPLVPQVCPFLFFFLLKNKIKNTMMLYNVVLVSGVQQISYIYIYIFFFILFSIIVYYKILYIIPSAM